MIWILLTNVDTFSNKDQKFRDALASTYLHHFLKMRPSLQRWFLSFHHPLLSLPSSWLYRTDLFMYALFKRSFSVEEKTLSIKINESTKIRFSSGLRCEQNLPTISQQKKIEESVLMKTSWRPLISVREFCFLENPDFRWQRAAAAVVFL